MTDNQDIKQAIANIRGIVDNMCEESLLSACPVILKAIFDDRQWDNDTYNLRDSFGYAVYKKGAEIKRGYLGEPSAKEPYKLRGSIRQYSVGSDSVWGRDQVDAFFNSYSSSFSEYEAVFVAGMWYANYLEWKGLLTGFINADQEAAKQIISAMKLNFNPIYKKK